jgi:hypothetical protein
MGYCRISEIFSALLTWEQKALFGMSMGVCHWLYVIAARRKSSSHTRYPYFILLWSITITTTVVRLRAGFGMMICLMIMKVMMP